MQAIGGPAGKPMDDIKAVDWLPLSAAIERLSLPHEQIFLRNVGRKALNRTLKKSRRRPTAEDAILPVAEVAPAIAARSEHAAAPADTAAPPRAAVVPRVKLVEPQPRWDVLTRLTRRWQAAVGRRTG
jgi:8-oxo-dGTP diphosphatase